MFNSFVFEKRLEEHKKLQSQEKKEIAFKKKHKKEMEQLVKGYNNRIQKFMVDMFDTPLQIKDYKEIPYQHRDISNKNLLGKPKFVTIGWQTERQRIEENIAKNSEITFHEAADHKKIYKILER